jgi:galactokinase
MGGHTEASEGLVLAGAVELDTWIAFRPRFDGQVRVASANADSAAAGAASDAAGVPAATSAASAAPASFLIEALEPTLRDGTWADGVGGAAWSLREAALPARGFDGVVDCAIPAALEIASPAALELASALALLGGRHVLSGPALASLAQRAERDYVGVDAGIVDYMASACGKEGRAALVDSRNLDVRQVALPYGVRLVVCYTGKLDPRPNELMARRADCSRALALLAERMPGLCSLRDLDDATLRRYRHLLPEVAAQRVEHVIAENARVLAAASAMDDGDLDSLGRLFEESHASLRDLYGVGSAELDVMIDVARAVPGVVAARMSGAGFGGSTVNLVLADAVPALEAAIRREYDGRTGLTGTAYPTALVNGAGPLAVPATAS